MFDYEWATVQHSVNCRLSQAVVVPDAIPPERLYRYGARRKIRAYEGLKEEYYLADFEPDPAVLGALGLDRATDRGGADAAGGVPVPPVRERSVRRGARAPASDVQTVVLPRTPEQRAELSRRGARSPCPHMRSTRSR